MTCIHCAKPIRWCDLALKWFHLHNLMTFCTDSRGPKATPADLELT